MNIEAANFQALNQNKSRGVRAYVESYKSDVLKHSGDVLSTTEGQSQINA